GIRREAEDAATASGAQDNGLGGDRLNLSRSELDGDHALNPAIVGQEPGDEVLIVAGYGRVLERGLKQCVEQVEAGFVGGKQRACFFHPAERPDRDAPIRFAAPGTAPMLQAHQFFWRLFDEGFYGALVAEPIAAGAR